MPPQFVHEREIWLVDLEPTLGVELRKIRPCLVLRKFSSRHLVIVPLTSKEKSAELSFCLEQISFLESEKSWLNFTQIRVADRQRFQRRFGKISPHLFAQIKKKTAEVFQLPPQGPSGHNADEV